MGLAFTVLQKEASASMVVSVRSQLFSRCLAGLRELTKDGKAARIRKNVKLFITHSKKEQRMKQ